MSNSATASSSIGPEECVPVDEVKDALAEMSQRLQAFQSMVDQLRAEKAQLQEDYDVLHRNFETLKTRLTKEVDGTNNRVLYVEGLVNADVLQEIKTTATTIREEIGLINSNLREWKIGQKPPGIEEEDS